MMRAFNLNELVLPLQASLHGQDGRVEGVSTDSRAVRAGDLFVALQGERFDGHQYLEQVTNAKAVAAVVSRQMPSALPQLVVADTQQALGRLGARNRDFYRGPLVAITGSSGKTTVKNMIAAVLARRGQTLATEGNLNNEIGVPLTLLRLVPDTQFAVVEMGAAGHGHIDWLCELARPTVSLLLNAMPAHLDGFGDIEDVASAKGEIFDRLEAGDCAVINADQPWASRWRKRAGDARILDFGLQQAAAITASGINIRGAQGSSFTASTPVGEIAIRLALPGIHNVANALATIAVGLACDLTLTEIRDGLETLTPVAGRLCTHLTEHGATVIDDSYNANPGSVRAAIDVLAKCDGQRMLILGAMLELGQESERHHREIGAYAKEVGIDRFWGVGPELEAGVEGFGEGGCHFADRTAALGALDWLPGEQDTILVKGSRGAGMEEILQALLDRASGRAESC